MTRRGSGFRGPVKPAADLHRGFSGSSVIYPLSDRDTPFT